MALNGRGAALGLAQEAGTQAWTGLLGEGECLLWCLWGGMRGKGAGPEQHTVLCSTGSGFPLVLQGIWMRLPGERISLRSHSLAVFVP